MQAAYVSPGSTATLISWVIPEQCKKVTNYLSSPLFVPMNNSAEWQSFVTHLPPGVALNNCQVYYSCYTYTQKDFCANANSVTLCNPQTPDCACWCNWNNGGGWTGWQGYPATYQELPYDGTIPYANYAENPYCTNRGTYCSKQYR